MIVAIPDAIVPIPDAILDEVYAHAREAFPDECCGYLLGENEARTVVRCRNAQADGLHPTHPERGADRGFVIAGRDLFEFARALSQCDETTHARGGDAASGSAAGGRPVVVYHSHTNGRAYFSAVDRQNALVDGRPVYPVQHLVIGVTAQGITEAALFAWSETATGAPGSETATGAPERGDFVEVARWDGRC